jgi:uncharacterized protein (TIGR02679 family)
VSQLDRLRRPDFERLLSRVRDAVERSGGEIGEGTVSLSGATEAEREALGGLLGRTVRSASPRVRLADLDDRFRAGPLAVGLVDIIERLGGPLRNRPEERAEAAEKTAAALDGLRASPIAREPWFESWLRALRQDGLLARAIEDGSLALAGRILAVLPAPGLPIAQFAVQQTGDTKALGPGPLATLVLRALAEQQAEPRPRDAESRRRLWDRAGVVVDDLASQVLVLGIAGARGSPLATWCTAAAEDRVPLRLTLHQLRRYCLEVPPQPVFVCENPAILRAAAGRPGAMLVCTEGNPSTACMELLRRCHGPMRARADFDPAGLRIATALVRRFGAQPWRMSAADYLTAPGGPELGEGCPDAPWDPELGPAMRARRRVVYEEELTELLVGDIAFGG